MTKLETYKKALQAKKWGFAGLLSAKAADIVPDTPEALPSRQPSNKENAMPEEARSSPIFHKSQGPGLQSSTSDSCSSLQKSVGRGDIETLKDKILATLKRHDCNDSGEVSGFIKSICLYVLAIAPIIFALFAMSMTAS